MKKKLVFVAALLSVLLLVPAALADVYVPPGPYPSMDAWICPWLFVFDMQEGLPVGWYYSDGKMYDPITQCKPDKIDKCEPFVPWPWLDVPWSTEVMILGFIPDVAVAPDQAPPDVKLKITWNGIPWVVTLHTDNIVGYDYPPEFYDDIYDTYEFAWPQETPYKDAYYNIWVGDITYIAYHLFGINITYLAKEYFGINWYETGYGYVNGLWFWYRFHPNVGDYIAYDCEPGETKFPPTYDITALFEYGTSQIWFPHVCFDVSLLDVHKVVEWKDEDELRDTITIENVGKENATGLDLMETFPFEEGHPGPGHGVVPDFTTVKAMITGVRTIGPTTLPDFWGSWPDPYVFQDEFSYLMPGEMMTIWFDLDVINTDDWDGTIVFDSMVSACEIPEWKYPIALHSIELGDPTGDEVPLWCGWKLYWGSGPWRFDFVCEWWVPTPILRDELTHPPPEMVLDPVPVDLNGDGIINAEDVSLVRQAIVGLIAYDYRMDINVNGEIDTQDLAAYKLAAGV